MKPYVAEYASHFLEASLGLPHRDLDPEEIPSDFVDSLESAVRGESGSSASPVLEEHVMSVSREIEAAALEERGFFVSKARWPEAAGYAVCLTHDIDNISRPIGHMLQRRNRFSSFDLILALLHLRSLYDNTDLVAEIERSRNVRSSFYLLSGNYDLARLRRRLARLVENGWEVGLHGDFGTHDSQEEMNRALRAFEEKTAMTPAGIREHYLKFDFGKTWGIIEKAGFDYDTSVGTTDTPGFKIGLCTPFHPPTEDWKPMRLLELPLVLMDTTLWGYQKLSESEGVKVALELKDRVMSVNGLFTLLWHPESLRMVGGRIYPHLLDRILEDHCFISNGASVSRWWREREAPLSRHGNEFELSAAPRGLFLVFKAKAGLRPAIDGGEVVERNGVTTINVKSVPFRLRVV